MDYCLCCKYEVPCGAIALVLNNEYIDYYIIHVLVSICKSFFLFIDFVNFF